MARFFIWFNYLGTELQIYNYIQLIRCTPWMNFKITGQSQAQQEAEEAAASITTEEDTLNICTENAIFGSKTKLFFSLLFCLMAVINHYFYIGTNSEKRMGRSSLVLRGDYKPETFGMLLFAILKFIQNDNGSHVLEYMVGLVGLTCILIMIARGKSWFTPKMKLAYSIPYLGGLWFMSAYQINNRLLISGKGFNNPVLISAVAFVGFVSGLFLMCPQVNIKYRSISSYGYQNEAEYLSDVEDLVYVYHKCVK